jgi:hypothetical protein
MIVVVDDLDCGVWDVAFERKVFTRYGTFGYINKSSEGPSYVYLHCDLLDKATSTIITLKTKSSHIKMHEHLLQKGYVCEGGEIWNKIKSKIHIVIIVK